MAVVFEFIPSGANGTNVTTANSPYTAVPTPQGVYDSSLVGFKDLTVAARFTATTGGASKAHNVLGAAVGTRWFSRVYRVEAAPSSFLTLMRLRSGGTGGTSVWETRCGTDRRLVFRDGASTVLATTTGQVTAGQPFRIETDFPTSTTATVRVYFDANSTTPDETFTGLTRSSSTSFDCISDGADNAQALTMRLLYAADSNSTPNPGLGPWSAVPVTVVGATAGAVQALGKAGTPVVATVVPGATAGPVSALGKAGTQSGVANAPGATAGPVSALGGAGSPSGDANAAGATAGPVTAAGQAGALSASTLLPGATAGPVLAVGNPGEGLELGAVRVPGATAGPVSAYGNPGLAVVDFSEPPGVALRDYQFELSGVVFGRGGTSLINVRTFDNGAAAIRSQTVDSESGDFRSFGRDRKTPPTWAWTANTDVRDVGQALNLVEILGEVWDAAETRDTPNAVLPLRYAVAGRTRRVYGRPQNFAAPPGPAIQTGNVPMAFDFALAEGVYYDDEVREDIFSVSPSVPDPGYVFPLVFPMRSLTRAAARVEELVIGGTRPTWLWFRFRGPCSNPTAIVGPVSLSLRGTIPEGITQEVTVSGRPWEQWVQRRDGTFAPGLLDPRARLMNLRLPPGTYPVRFTAEDLTGTAKLIVGHHDAYGTM